MCLVVASISVMMAPGSNCVGNRTAVARRCKVSQFDCAVGRFGKHSPNGASGPCAEFRNNRSETLSSPPSARAESIVLEHDCAAHQHDQAHRRHRSARLLARGSALNLSNRSLPTHSRPRLKSMQGSGVACKWPPQGVLRVPRLVQKPSKLNSLSYWWLTLRARPKDLQHPSRRCRAPVHQIYDSCE